MTTQQAVSTGSRRRGAGVLIAAAVGFVLLYLATDFVTPNFASSTLPLPNDPVADVRDWYADNQLAAVLMGVTQFLSVSSLAVFVTRLPGVVRTVAQQVAAERARIWGLAAVALMMLSSALAWLLAAMAPSASLDTVSVLRTSNFIAGGTAHVLALGVFVLLAARMPGFGKPVRVLAYVAAVVSALSLSSLFFFQGAAFILLGRLLCMVWTVSAAVSITRRMSKGE
ncbi:hypothetical protein [Aeromicrobium sp.]|uniref:hypothetical protein n=1 Tax=Aeromicrobium sp. TaxID=1871063 RepID=UPI003C41F80B